MERTLETVLLIMEHHTAPAGAQVGVIVHTKKEIKRYVPMGHGAKKSSHEVPPCRKKQSYPEF